MLNKTDRKILPVVIASVQWYISTILQMDRLFFTYELDTKLILVVKGLYLVFLIIGWLFLFHCYAELKSDNKLYKRGLYCFIVYFSILMLLLLILWPGTWAWDDAITLYHIRSYTWFPWQHILTSIYYMILLQILPFPGGIILLQNVICALCVAFIIVKLENSFHVPQLKNSFLDILIKILPFLAPPILMYQFSGYRMGLYIYLEMTMLIIWLCSKGDCEEWSWKYIFLFCSLCTIVSSWRTESSLYLPFILLLILYTKKRILPLVKKIGCVVLLISCFGIINHTQNVALGDEDYKLVSILRPCVELVHVADKKEDGQLLDGLSKVIDLDVIYDNPEQNGEYLYFYSNVVKNEYTDDDYRDCLISFVKLCIKYPKVVICERLSIFIQALGITGGETTNADATYSFFDDNRNGAAIDYSNAGWIISKPIFLRLRKMLIHLLNIQYNEHTFAIRKLIWNAIIPIMVILYIWCKTVQKRNWHIFWWSSAILIRIPVVGLTEPAQWFMYWLSFYMIGIFMMVWLLFTYCNRKVRRMQKNER